MDDSFETAPNRRSRKIGAEYAKSEKILNRYEVLTRIGAGGNGKIYQCIDSMDHSILTVKTFCLDSAQEFDYFQEKFQRLSSLLHPNLLLYKRFTRDEMSNECFMITEYVEGMTLRDWMKLHPDLPQKEPEKLFSLLWEIASALDYLHDRSQIHGDIKPENILISTDGHVKIIDLDHAPSEGEPMTGTAQYMAPEQWLGDRLTGSADQYSLAAVVYELFTGNFPFSEFPAEELKRVVLTKRPTALSAPYEKLSECLLKALEKDAQNRYGSCTAFADELTEKFKQKRKTNKILYLSAATAAVLILAVILTIFLLTGSKKDIPVQPNPQPPPVPVQPNPQPETDSVLPKPLPELPVSSPVQPIRLEQSVTPRLTVPESRYLAVKATTGRTSRIFYEGEELALTVVANKDCYIIVYVKQSDGSQVVLFPNYCNSNNKLIANVPIRIPGSNRPGFKITVSPPWGKDKIYVLASTEAEDIFTKIAERARSSRRTFVQTKGLAIAPQQDEPQKSTVRETADFCIEIETRPGWDR